LEGPEDVYASRATFRIPCMKEGCDGKHIRENVIRQFI
jgi:hypothetical protein